ncbi:MAG: extracellular solute-binding protein [Clostridia bacterium]|nr:extracellular solute-binding protein [Clostridia bacterium]
MKKFKKALLLCLAVMIAVSAAGCGKGGETKIDTGSGEMPKTLSIYASLGPYTLKAGAKDYNDTLYFQLLEELTGCHIEWVHPAEGAGAEKFSLLIASGQLPDMMVTDWVGVSGGVKSFAEDEVIIPLKQLINDNMPSLKAYNDANPNVLKQYTADDGEVYYIPFIKGNAELKTYQGPQIRMDWLEKLGLEVPTNPDELYNVLKAFKEQDPNGNGKNDEIPMSGVMFTGGHGIGNLIWMFGSTMDIYMEDGKVKYGVMEDSFEEGLRYIVKLFSEGLIDIDYLLNDRSKMDNKFMNDRVGFIYSLQPGNFYKNMNDGTRKVLGIPYLANEGVKYNVFDSTFTDDVSPVSIAVTTANKNPSGSLKWLDTLYSEKGIEIMNYGKEGLTFEYVDGKPQLTDYIYNNPNGKSQQEMSGLCLGTYQANFPTQQTWDSYNQILSPWGRESIEIWGKSANCDGTIPASLSLSDEEMDIIAQTMSQIETYVSENINKIVIGSESIDALPKIRETIQKMGIDNVIKAYSSALERYNNK